MISYEGGVGGKQVHDWFSYWYAINQRKQTGVEEPKATRWGGMAAPGRRTRLDGNCLTQATASEAPSCRRFVCRCCEHRIMGVMSLDKLELELRLCGAVTVDSVRAWNQHML
ncbi:hypothetical protein V2G26_017004 [Clonostachys chloroleuca]